MATDVVKVFADPGDSLVPERHVVVVKGKPRVVTILVPPGVAEVVRAAEIRLAVALAEGFALGS